MISIYDMADTLLAHDINTKIQLDNKSCVWKIYAKKGDISDVWEVSAVDGKTSNLARDIIRKMIIENIINFFIEKEREKEQKMKNNEQKFTRDDLKPGHIIKLRNGKYYSIQMAGNETRIATDGVSDWKYLTQGWNMYLDSTTHGGRTYPAITYDKTKDIMAVYGHVQGTENYAQCGYISPDHRPRLWYRQEAKKMTVEEIEKELGYKVEIVSD